MTTDMMKLRHAWRGFGPFAQQVKELDRVPARRTQQEQVEEHAHHVELGDLPLEREANAFAPAAAATNGPWPSDR